MKKKSITDWREGSVGRTSVAQAGGPDFTSAASRESGCRVLSVPVILVPMGKHRHHWGSRDSSREPAMSSRFAVSNSKEESAWCHTWTCTSTGILMHTQEHTHIPHKNKTEGYIHKFLYFLM